MPFFLFSLLLIGGSGFLSGFLLPIFLNPEANQGPLLGILITGPLGLVVGALVGFVLPLFSKGPGKKRFVWGSAVAIWATMFVVCQPPPERLGMLYLGEITEKVPATSSTAEAVVGWEEKAKSYPWHQPRAGWQAEMSSSIEKDEGEIVTIRPTGAWEVKRERKFWNSGVYVLEERPFGDPVRAYMAEGNSVKGGYYLTRSKLPGSDWPPREIPNFLGITECVAMPSDLPLPH